MSVILYIVVLFLRRCKLLRMVGKKIDGTRVSGQDLVLVKFAYMLI